MKTIAAMLALCLLLLSAAPASALENGVYRDKAEGYGGEVIVTVIIRDGRIQSLTTENTAGEKSEYYLKAEEALSEAIVAANGLDGVDTVSGATGTSQSILTAMHGVLEQAAYTGETAPTNSVREPTMTADPKPTV